MENNEKVIAMLQYVRERMESLKNEVESSKAWMNTPSHNTFLHLEWVVRYGEIKRLYESLENIYGTKMESAKDVAYWLEDENVCKVEIYKVNEGQVLCDKSWAEDGMITLADVSLDDGGIRTVLWGDGTVADVVLKSCTKDTVIDDRRG